MIWLAFVFYLPCKVYEKCTKLSKLFLNNFFVKECKDFKEGIGF